MDLIAAVDSAWAIGKGEKLLFSIPEDLHRFKELTLGGTIVYGRRTMQTFPGGKPLPGRLNYVLSRRPEFLEGDCRGVSSVGELLELTQGQERVYLVGGESVYRQLLSQCAFAYITKVDTDAGGDRFLENLDAAPDWELVEESEPRQFEGLTYRFCTYRNLDLDKESAEQRKKRWLVSGAAAALLGLLLSQRLPEGRGDLYFLLVVLMAALWGLGNVLVPRLFHGKK